MKPSPPATACILRLRTGPARAVAKGRRVAGQPVRRFLKELIKAGHYVKESDGLEFDVTPALIEHWAATFARMRANGLNVPVPSGHTHDGAANRGWVRHLFRAGDSLYGVVDLVGDGIPMAATNDVSIYAVPEFTDGHGNRYRWPILHVALCTDPVVPGLGGFLPIAAGSIHPRPTCRCSKGKPLQVHAFPARPAWPPGLTNTTSPEKPSQVLPCPLLTQAARLRPQSRFPRLSARLCSRCSRTTGWT